MKNILVTGANGQLGSEFRLLKGNDPLFIFTDIEQLDICDMDAVDKFVSSNNIGTIINCAAYTNVDKAEDDVAAAYRLNEYAVRILADTCVSHDIQLIHISTDYVFDGKKRGSYSETDKCSPVSVYGASKRAGELEIMKSGARSIILRTSWLYSTFGKNFVKKMIEISEDEFYVSVVDDQKGCPTYARDLAEAILEIMPGLEEKPRYGEIFHYSNEGQCSWFEFAEKIMALGKFECTVEPISSDQYPSKASRPANSVMDKSLIKAAFGIKIPAWERSLSKMIREYKKNNNI